MQLRGEKVFTLFGKGLLERRLELRYSQRVRRRTGDRASVAERPAFAVTPILLHLTADDPESVTACNTPTYAGRTSQQDPAATPTNSGCRLDDYASQGRGGHQQRPPGTMQSRLTQWPLHHQLRSWPSRCKMATFAAKSQLGTTSGVSVRLGRCAALTCVPLVGPVRQR